MDDGVEVNLVPLAEYERAIRQAAGTSAAGHMRTALRQWGLRYRSEMQERFDRFSKGGGDWPPLAASTIRRRRKGKGRTVKIGSTIRTVARGTVSILRDTGTLFMALQPQFSGRPGQLQEDIPYGERVGFGGPAQHPKGALTVGALAAIHHAGGKRGRPPQRTLLVDPSLRTVALMAQDVERALQRIARETGVA